MFLALLWGLVILYVVASIFRVVDYHQITSVLALLFLGLFEITRRQELLVNRLLWGFPTVLLAVACLYLSPAQVKLLGGQSGQDRYPDTYEPKNGKSAVDIVAVHGIGSHPEKAWVHKETSFNWLKALPEEEGINARVMMYYHNTQWESKSLALSLDDVAQRLLKSVISWRRKSDPTRPIIFIGYSFGGLIVKKAMILHTRRETLDDSLIGFCFLGTPHHGSGLTMFGEILSVLGYWTGSSTRLLRIMRRGSPENADLHMTFMDMFSHVRGNILNVREMVPEYLGPFPLTQVVSEVDANIDVQDRAALASDHRGLQRFRSKDDALYKMMLDDLKFLIERVQRSSGRIEQEVTEESRRQTQILKGIPDVPGAEFKHVDQQAQSCTPGTRVGLLQDIENWACDPKEPRGFWLQGLAGTGKSTVARTVAGDFSCGKYRDRFVVASFFFKRGAGDRATARKFTTTLAKQLGRHEDLKRTLTNAYEQNPGVDEHALEYQWRHLIREPLLKAMEATGHRTVLLVVDAVDECQRTGMAGNEVLEFLLDEQYFEGLNIRLFVTSRPMVKEERTGIHSLFKLHKIDPIIVEADIRRFLEFKFRNDFHPQTGFPRKEHIDALARRASPLFIAAVTSYKFIEEDEADPEYQFNLLMKTTRGYDTDADVASKTISQVEEELDDMYLVVVKQALGKGKQRGRDTILRRNLERYQIIMGSLLALRDSLNYVELALLLFEDPDRVRTFLGFFQAVLQTGELPKTPPPTDEPPEPIQIFHQSLPDFLLNEDRVRAACESQTAEQRVEFKDVWIDVKVRNTALFYNCVGVMERLMVPSDPLCTLNHDGIMDICKLRGPGQKAAAISENTLNEAIPPRLRYACRYWVTHLVEGTPEADQNRLWDFLRQHLLHWIEIMSCLGSLSDTIAQLDQVEKYLNRAGSIHGELLGLVADAGRFVRFGRNGIQEAPLQVYYSALIFAPRNSKVKQMFDREIPWIELRPSVAEGWDAKLMEFTNHESNIRSVMFSADGVRIASVDVQNNLLVWVGTTGAVISRATIGNPECLDVSCKDLLAFGNVKGEVVICENMEKRNQRTLCGHEGGIDWVRFSPDGQWLASFDNKGTLMLWEISSDFRRVTLHAEIDGLCTGMAFSSVQESEGRAGEILFAVAIQRFEPGDELTTVTVWSKRQGVEWEMFRDFTCEGALSSDLIFSHRKLFCALWVYPTKDIAITECDLGSKTRDIRTKDLQGSFEYVRRVEFLARPQANRDQIACIACDPNGSMWRYDLAGSGDRHLKAQDFEDSKDALFSRVFPDSSLIAGSLLDSSWCMWKTDTGERVTKTNGVAYGIPRIPPVFAPSGSILAVVTGRNLIQLWDCDLASRQRLQPQRLSTSVSSSVRAETVSANGQRAAVLFQVGDKSFSIELYDLSTAYTATRVLKRLEPPIGVGVIRGVPTMLFSPDSSWIAVRSQEQVSLWDLNSWDGKASPTRTIEATNKDYFHKGSIAFSLDTKSIAYLDGVGTVLVARLDSRSTEARQVHELDSDSHFLSLTASKSRFYVAQYGLQAAQVIECGLDTPSVLVYQSDHDPMHSILADERLHDGFYSPARSMFAVQQHGRGIHIYNSSPSVYYKSFHHPGYFQTCHWCDRGCCLFNERYGSLQIDPESPPHGISDPCKRLPISSAESSNWILWKGKPFLWLPSHPNTSEISFYSNTLGMRLSNEPTWLRFGSSILTLQALVEKQPLESTYLFQEMTERRYCKYLKDAREEVRIMEEEKRVGRREKERREEERRLEERRAKEQKRQEEILEQTLSARADLSDE